MTDRRESHFLWIIARTLLLLFAVAIILPFLWMFATSLRLPRDSFTLPPHILPKPPLMWSNYVKVFTSFPFFTHFLNSLIISSSAVLGQVIVSSMAAFAFSRIEFPGRNTLFLVVLAGLMVPSQVTIIPLFIIISRIGLGDTRWAVLFPSLIYPLGVFLIRQFMLTIPRDYDEAAALEGVGKFGIFRSIILPMVRPALFVSAMMHLLMTWNDFFRPLIFLNSLEKMTLPLGLYQLKGFMGAGSISIVLAGVVVSIIPPLLFFAAGQKHLMLGLSSGIKG